ncbi:TPA: hypothetical protein ACXDAY_002228 [Clostridium botulinum]|uniref:hypothetical protein n=2 Tax=Clostridium botulinum TaxID=1491 RepID=UPI0007747EDB|nr:hypothetical protein [Clostridium botulinum]APH20857.1 hypothetical protein NPD1_4142 [Clostridium botulinum]APQ71204.1 hypothetical protein RSJ8_4099 [Clostridium botulinum]AUN01479.1 hypothetical protein RSJ19_00410 [Clostridium botulinum]MBN3359207.1 hypothetical protein [Clostridium botulinum]MBN3379049.1 hypothetical protein [Clostridium botulinum]
MITIKGIKATVVFDPRILDNKIKREFDTCPYSCKTYDDKRIKYLKYKIDKMKYNIKAKASGKFGDNIYYIVHTCKIYHEYVLHRLDIEIPIHLFKGDKIQINKNNKITIDKVSYENGNIIYYTNDIIEFINNDKEYFDKTIEKAEQKYKEKYKELEIELQQLLEERENKKIKNKILKFLHRI